MEVLLVLLGLAALALPFAVIYLLIALSGLKARIALLEQRQAMQVPDAPLVPQIADVAPKLPALASKPEPVVEAAQAGPWSQPTPPLPQPAPAPPSRLIGWLRENWVYAVSAASLGLAGIFFVQYGIENGLLPPWLRVLAGVSFGGALVISGEWLRRRHGDDEADSTAYLPSVFAGAGLVSIFAATLAARQMYGLIGPATAFAAHLVTAAGAVALGWFYGPLLVAVGLIGAAVAPFIVAGGSAPTGWLYGYFALIAAVGLAVDAVRAWPWVSRLALVLAYGGGFLMMAGGAGSAGFIAMMLAMAVLAATVPVLSVVPRHAGPSALQVVLLRKGLPSRAVVLALVGGAVSSLGILGFVGGAAGEAMLAFGALALLALGYLLWAERAEGLADLALLPALSFVAGLLMVGLGGGGLLSEMWAERAPEVAAPWTITWLLAMAAGVSGGFALRSFRPEALRLIHVLGAVLVAPVAAAVLELAWSPAPVIGVFAWALHVMALAVAMVLLAVRYARDADRRPVAYATLSALSLIALSLFVLTSATALTLALAVLVLAAAGLDQRFKLPEMGWFIQIAVAVLGYRLLADPGLDWAMAAPVGQVVLAYGGVIAALLAAIWLLRDVARPMPKGVLESAAAGLAAILANILITRWLLPDSGGTLGYNLETHWGAALNAMPWLALMLMQIYRARLGGVMLRLRQALAVLGGVLGAGGMLMAVGPFNPLIGISVRNADKVRGPMGVDTLLLAYGVPGLVLLVAALRLGGVGRRLRLVFATFGAALIALYVGLEIRRFFQGDYLGGAGVTQGELYTYTLAMMLLGAGLLYQAIAKRSTLLRKLAMAVIAVTVAKVFLLDAAGLTGLTRVVSFLGLGLSLAGLAWLNRWAGKVSEQERGP